MAADKSAEEVSVTALPGAYSSESEPLLSGSDDFLFRVDTSFGSDRFAGLMSKPDGAEKADSVSSLLRAVADFDGDGKADILWQTLQGIAQISIMNRVTVVDCGTLGPQTDRVLGTGDFNGDGKADIVWRNMNTGAVRISLMDGGTVTSWLNVGQTPIPLSVKLEAVGDFDGNGRADMLWRNQSTGRAVMSYHAADGSVTDWPQVSNFIALNTSALKVGDINGDGKDDIVWRNMGTGNVVLSLMDGNVATWRGITASPIALSVALEAIGDFDNNGRADLLWRNTRTGNSLMSYHNVDGSVASWPVVSNYINPMTTSAQGVGDFDGDGKDDILWRNLGSGNTVISIMNGNGPDWLGASFTACQRRVPHSGLNNMQCSTASSGYSGSSASCSGSDAIALSDQQDGHRTHINTMSYSAVGSYLLSECVRDDVTGLVWEGKSSSGMRGKDMLFTNYGDGRIGDASAYVAAMNAQQLCGFSDWRMPQAAELLGLADLGVRAANTPMVNAAWFPNTANSWYWSATSSPLESYYAYRMSFERSSAVSSGAFLQADFGRPTQGHVRLVRGASIYGTGYRYITVPYGTDAANNVAVDVLTGLQWRRCAEGQTWSGSTCTGNFSTFFYNRYALAHARQRVGWRVPNVKELASIVDWTRSGPMVDPAVFPATPSRQFVASATSHRVYFPSGGVYTYDERNNSALRLVRIAD
jgi:hypothetical protein